MYSVHVYFLMVYIYMSTLSYVAYIPIKAHLLQSQVTGDELVLSPFSPMAHNNIHRAAFL